MYSQKKNPNKEAKETCAQHIDKIQESLEHLVVPGNIDTPNKTKTKSPYSHSSCQRDRRQLKSSQQTKLGRFEQHK